MAKKLRPGAVATISGQLGAGKTTLIQGIAERLGIKQNIISPTFVLGRFFKIPKSTNHLGHFDFYRLPERTDWRNLEFADYFHHPQTICLVEWPERLTPTIPQAVNIEIKIIEQNKRAIKLKL